MKLSHPREDHIQQPDFYQTIAEASFGGIYVVQDGRFSYLNRNAASYAGYTPMELVGREAFSIVHQEDRDLVRRLARKMLKGLRTEPCEFRIITRDGQTRWIMETVISITYQGKPAILGNSMDVTEKKQAEAVLSEQKMRYKTLFEGANDAIFIMEDYVFTDCNNRALEVFKCKRENLVGATPDRFSPPLQSDGASSSEKSRERMDAALRGESQLFEWLHCRYDGTPFPAEVSLSRLDIAGKVLLQSIVLDITNIKQAEQDLKESESKYRKIYDNAVVGMFQSTPEGRFVHVNPALAKMCGFASPEEMIESVTDMAAQHYVYPDDREFFKETIKKQGFVDNFEHATFRKDGTIFWVSVNARVVLDKSGNVLHYEGTHIDMTDRKLAQDALKASEERYRAIIENIGDGYYEVDLNGCVQFMNDSCALITGVPHHKLIGANFKEFAVEGEEGELYRIFHRVFMTAEPEKGLVTRVNRPDGKEQYVEISVSLKKDSKGKPTGFMGILHDVTERKKAEETIQWMAYHDALTGLPNRILFHDRLAVALTQAKRNREHLAVMMLDLDKFKEINDSYGHYMGDCILCAFVEGVKKQLREGDTVARMGGDEFMILLPGIRQVEDLEKLGQKIIDAFQVPIKVGELFFTIRTSIGIALYPRDGQDFDTLVKKADIAMYGAKKRGGNKYIICC
ncbi:MAG: PAS domain S-box protein [Syntrophales bacterium]